MPRIRLSLLIFLLMMASPALAQQQRDDQLRTLTGYYRICASRESEVALRAAMEKAVEAKDVTAVENWRHPDCRSANITISLIREAAEYPPMVSWNFVYDPNSKADPYETRDPSDGGAKVAIPYRAELQYAKYYYAHYTRPDGERITVIAEVFATNVFAQWKEARKRRR